MVSKIIISYILFHFIIFRISGANLYFSLWVTFLLFQDYYDELIAIRKCPGLKINFNNDSGKGMIAQFVCAMFLLTLFLHMLVGAV